MARTAKNRRTPYLPPVQKIELNDAHTKLRIVLMLVLLAVGLALIGYSITSWLTPQTGWTEIQAETARGLSCADDFVFLYPLGAGGGSPTAERKALISLYSRATQDAYQLFTNDAEFEGVHNVRYINRHPNEEIEIDPGLYAALAQVAESGDRSLYLAPVYAIYDGIFSCEEDAQTADYDPRQNESLREWFASVCAYANDPEQVNLELLSENRVRLSVSGAYLAFAEAEEIEDFIDFYWMKNAFIADYLANVFLESGCRIGTISSVDGFARNLDAASGTVYALNLYDRVGQIVYPAAVMQYTGARSIVSMRSYPANATDARFFRALADGEIRTARLDVRDGLCRSAINDLTAYSAEKGCGEVLLELIPIYVADAFRAEALTSIAAGGTHSVYCERGEIHHTEAALSLTSLYSGEDIEYREAP